MADLTWLRYHSPESGAERRSDLHFSGKISAIRSKHQFFIDKSYSLLLSNNSSFVPNKVHCEMWETGADRPFSLCFEGKKKRFRTHWNMAWANCQVVDYGVDVTDEGGLGKGWRWLERPHGNRTVHSLEVWADLFSWIDLVTWVVVEGRGYCFRDSIDILDPMD
jgi:hypothetical protein